MNTFNKPNPNIPSSNSLIPGPPIPDLLVTDFHTHTIYSHDSLVTPERLLAACRRKGIDRVVVSDHNTIAGALHAKNLDPERVIVGEEILTTSNGEILAVYVSEEIPAGLAPMEVIARLREQNAFISVSHPFDKLRHSWSLKTLLQILPYIDAIETFNARCMLPWYNWQAQKFAQEHGLMGTHGSDAHTTIELGRGSLRLPPFHNAASLKEAVQHAAKARATLSAPWIHFTSRYAVWRKSLNGDMM
ncbi:MAG: PHP domain-containing protein [Chloroflexota bacterium]|nr:PHP domain-containing protein [Chloroflexota bacterium]